MAEIRRSGKKRPKKTSRRNPVAKSVNRVNRPAVHKDRKKALKRGEPKFSAKDVEQD